MKATPAASNAATICFRFEARVGRRRSQNRTCLSSTPNACPRSRWVHPNSALAALSCWDEESPNPLEFDPVITPNRGSVASDQGGGTAPTGLRSGRDGQTPPRSPYRRAHQFHCCGAQSSNSEAPSFGAPDKNAGAELQSWTRQTS